MPVKSTVFSKSEKNGWTERGKRARHPSPWCECGGDRMWSIQAQVPAVGGCCPGSRGRAESAPPAGMTEQLRRLKNDGWPGRFRGKRQMLPWVSREDGVYRFGGNTSARQYTCKRRRRSFPNTDSHSCSRRQWGATSSWLSQLFGLKNMNLQISFRP